MPPYAFHYAVPLEFYEKHHVRRYGFHGTSHKFVGRRAAEMLGKPFSKFTGITCHLGNGCSMAAIRNGQSVDTSMGLTPLEGLIMGTRCGDIDPALGFFLTREAGIPFEQLDSLLNRKSGMLGISGLSNDVRALVEAAARGHKRATLALDMFAYRVRKYIGAYMAALNGCDAIVFTGGIGENAGPLRERICSNLEYLGVSHGRRPQRLGLLARGDHQQPPRARSPSWSSPPTRNWRLRATRPGSAAQSNRGNIGSRSRRRICETGDLRGRALRPILSAHVHAAGFRPALRLDHAPREN